MTGSYRLKRRVTTSLTILFIIGIGITLYIVYSLPFELRLPSDYFASFSPLYLSIALTGALGFAALFLSFTQQKEIVVLRSQKNEAGNAEKQTAQETRSAANALQFHEIINKTKDRKEIFTRGLQEICHQLEAGQGALYRIVQDGNKHVVRLESGYALGKGESTVIEYEVGEGLVGQVAASGKKLYIDDVPDGYITVLSGLGKASPRYLLIVPMGKEGAVEGVIEIATFKNLTTEEQQFVEESASAIENRIKGISQ